MYYIKLIIIQQPILSFIGYLVFPLFYLSFLAMIEKYKIILLIWAIALLVCLAPMPYGYFMLVRFVSTILFCLMAYEYHEIGRKELSFVFVALALLFQPFLKISLGRGIWNFVDVIVAIYLLILFFKKPEKE